MMTNVYQLPLAAQAYYTGMALGDVAIAQAALGGIETVTPELAQAFIPAVEALHQVVPEELYGISGRLKEIVSGKKTHPNAEILQPLAAKPSVPELNRARSLLCTAKEHKDIFPNSAAETLRAIRDILHCEERLKVLAWELGHERRQYMAILEPEEACQLQLEAAAEARAIFSAEEIPENQLFYFSLVKSHGKYLLRIRTEEDLEAVGEKEKLLEEGWIFRHADSVHLFLGRRLPNKELHPLQEVDKKRAGEVVKKLILIGIKADIEVPSENREQREPVVSSSKQIVGGWYTYRELYWDNRTHIQLFKKGTENVSEFYDNPEDNGWITGMKFFGHGLPAMGGCIAGGVLGGFFAGVGGLLVGATLPLPLGLFLAKLPITITTHLWQRFFSPFTPIFDEQDRDAVAASIEVNDPSDIPEAVQCNYFIVKEKELGRIILRIGNSMTGRLVKPKEEKILASGQLKRIGTRVFYEVGRFGSSKTQALLESFGIPAEKVASISGIQ